MKSSFKILFEDADVLVADKPAGIAVIPQRNIEVPCLQKELEKTYGKLFVVHRIDKNTSGVICFAKNEAAHKFLNEEFEKHNVKKLYKAIVRGRLMNKAGQINFPIAPHPVKPNIMVTHPKGKKSLTIYKVEEEFKHASVLNVEIKTGRTHQIRVHLAAIGHGLLVDEVYAGADAFYLSSIKKNYKTKSTVLPDINIEDKENKELLEMNTTEKPIISRLTLHASELHFHHPSTKEVIICKSEMPDDLQVLLKLLRKYDV
ncbi:MAG: RluA family pseudouridine synthase [Fimbriimonadaceae bacterium]|nr:RluA family pseudouridine synthase [Chitinophagales bacterium]